MDDMRQALSVTLLAGALLPWPLARAQMHKVAKPEQVVRAVGVYEWVGDLKKPTGSRFIPVTVFINGALEDGGVYMARPIPFALTPGNEYELQQAGVPRGSLDLTDARHLQTANNDYEDGWLGYGTYKTPPPPRKEPALRASKTQPTIEGSRDDSRPHFSGNQPASDSKSSSDKDPQTSTDSQTKKSTGADDPDRPTMHRRDTSGTSTTDSTKASTSDPANDPDRPTLRRRSPEDAKKAKNNDIATVTGTGTSLNDDPDRPKLQHGKPTATLTTRTSPGSSASPKTHSRWSPSPIPPIARPMTSPVHGRMKGARRRSRPDADARAHGTRRLHNHASRCPCASRSHAYLPQHDPPHDRRSRTPGQGRRRQKHSRSPAAAPRRAAQVLHTQLRRRTPPTSTPRTPAAPAPISATSPSSPRPTSTAPSSPLSKASPTRLTSIAPRACASSMSSTPRPPTGPASSSNSAPRTNASSLSTASSVPAQNHLHHRDHAIVRKLGAPSKKSRHGGTSPPAFTSAIVFAHPCNDG